MLPGEHRGVGHGWRKPLFVVFGVGAELLGAAVDTAVRLLKQQLRVCQPWGVQGDV